MFALIMFNIGHLLLVMLRFIGRILLTLKLITPMPSHIDLNCWTAGFVICSLER